MNLRIFTTTWQQDAPRLGLLRRDVFVIEQRVPEELEWDEYDASAIHFACEDSVQAAIIGIARLIVDAETSKGTIGRLCVAQPFRHHKIATRLMQAIITYCTGQKIQTMELHAQSYLKAFYEGFGFIAQGGFYLEAGIEHITMVKGAI